MPLGVATICRLLKIIGLFCKRALQKRPIFSKETYNFKEATDGRHHYVDARDAFGAMVHNDLCHMRISRVTYE